MDKKSRDNRSNQLNPNNDEFYKSRGLTPPKHKGAPVKKVVKQNGSGNPYKCPICGSSDFEKKGHYGAYPRFCCNKCGGCFYQNGNRKIPCK